MREGIKIDLRDLCAWFYIQEKENLVDKDREKDERVLEGKRMDCKEKVFPG